jgi:hypothetical protein
MSYTFNKLISTDYIGNSLNSVNLNYDSLDLWTNNIILSSEQYYEPMKNFYLFYRDFWKDTINYSIEINAIPRLTSFQTNVLENSAKWISPIVLYYPLITENNIQNLQNLKQNALEWMNNTYPVSSIGNANLVENTIGLVYCLLYEEKTRIDTTFTKISTTRCTTNNSSATVQCWIAYLNNIGCYGDRNVCANFSRTIANHPNSPSCENIFTIECDYENGQKQIDRNGIVNINSYFLDRYEKDEFYLLKMIVKSCNWTIYE